MNNKAHLRPKDFDSNGDIIPMSWKEEKGDLISREALKKAIKDNGYSHYFEIFDIIDNTPTVELTETEVQEVLNKRCMTAVANEYLIALHGKRPQGEWKIEETPQYSEIRCPFCQFSPNEVWLPNFCSNCGAKMKKGGGV